MTGSDAPHTRYQEFAPDPPCAAYVLNYWRVVVDSSYPPGSLHVIWPDGCVSLSVRAGHGAVGVRIVGPRVDALRVPLFPDDAIWGIRFRPEAGAAALGASARRLRGHIGLADEFLGDAAAGLPEAIGRAGENGHRAIGRWLSNHVTSPAIDDVARRAVDALVDSGGSAPIAPLAESLGVSLRQLQRRFGDAVGLTPKQFARIRRMREALAKLLETPREGWSNIAADLGYADQAHLIRDMARLTGITPTEVAERMERIAHTDVHP